MELTWEDVVAKTEKLVTDSDPSQMLVASDSNVFVRDSPERLPVVSLIRANIAQFQSGT